MHRHQKMERNLMKGWKLQKIAKQQVTKQQREGKWQFMSETN